MGLRLLLILIGISGFFADARADILTYRQDLVGADVSDRVEVTTFLAETESDRNELVDRLRNSLAGDLAKNPNLETGFENVVDGIGRAPSSVDSGSGEALEKIAGGRKITLRTLTGKVRQALRIRYPDWFVRHSKMIFSVSRGTTNGVITTWGLMASQHIPFEVAAPAGILAGLISGRLQFLNEEMQTYLTKSLVAKLVRQKTLASGAKFFEQSFRWYILEVGFVAAIQSTLAIMGHPPSGTLAHIAGNNLHAALAAVAGQGLWDIAVSKVAKSGLERAKDAVARRAVQFRSDFITLGLSALSVAGMIGKISGHAFGNTIFWAMGVSGAAYSLRVFYRDWRCGQLMKFAEPPAPVDPLSGPPAGAEPYSTEESALPSAS